MVNEGTQKPSKTVEKVQEKGGEMDSHPNGYPNGNPISIHNHNHDREESYQENLLAGGGAR